MKELRIEYMPLDKLIRAPRNPKGHDLGAIHESLDAHGFVEPLVLNETTGRMVVGHGRLDSLQQMKVAGEPPPDRVRVTKRDGENTVWLVPVVRGIAFETDEAAEAYLIGSNRLVQLGGWLDDDLAKVMADLAAADKLAGTGFDKDDVDALLKDAGAAGPKPKNVSEDKLGSGSDYVEALAELIHDAGKEAVKKGWVLAKPEEHPGWVEYDDLPVQAKEGRRSQARFLVTRAGYVIELLNRAGGGDDDTE